jgi:hypothetical protein
MCIVRQPFCLFSSEWLASHQSFTNRALQIITNYYRHPLPPPQQSQWLKANKTLKSQTPAAHACNPSYLGGWDQEDCGSRPAWANSSQDPISKITRAKWTEGVAQVIQWEAQSSSPSPTKKKKKPKQNLPGEVFEEVSLRRWGLSAGHEFLFLSTVFFDIFVILGVLGVDAQWVTSHRRVMQGKKSDSSIKWLENFLGSATR